MAANEHQRTDQQDVCEPAHHARRPMNAFLIFCKRHRSSVRSGFPHLENRAVTRVLGEWWATLNPEQKLCYTNLAQEYKDAFLNANPDFKWYKLPAPPLRTLNTRPSNKKLQQNVENESEEFDDNDEDEADSTDGNKIQSGKLADESQIGGLSLLITPAKTQVGPEDALDGNSDPTISKPPKKRYSEPIIMKKDVRANLFPDKVKTESNNNYHLNMDEMNSSETSNDFELSRINFRSERTCKGLRYQKFLAEQMRSLMLPLQNKRKKIRLNSDSKLHEKEHSEMSIQEKCENELEHLVESAEGKVEASKPEETKTETIENLIDCGSWFKRKRFKAEDFNLEKKIEALPSLSLEEFQQKKKQQRSKKTKFIQKSHKNHSNVGRIDTKKVTTVKNDFDEDECMLVGSKKRKARKQNITRNAALATAGESSGAKGQNDNKPWCPPSELNALECLATVAANRTKLN